MTAKAKALKVTAPKPATQNASVVAPLTDAQQIALTTAVEVLATPDLFEQHLIDNADTHVGDRNDLALNPISTYLLLRCGPVAVHCGMGRLRVAGDHHHVESAPSWTREFLHRIHRWALGADPIRGDDALEHLRLVRHAAKV